MLSLLDSDDADATEHRPLPARLRETLLDSGGIFARELGHIAPKEPELRKGVEARDAVFIARALLHVARGRSIVIPNATGGFDAWFHTDRLVLRMKAFWDEWHSERRRRKRRSPGAAALPERPWLDDARRIFGADAPLVDALWPANKFLIAAYDADEIVGEIAFWEEADHLLLTLSPEVRSFAIEQVARRTGRRAQYLGHDVSRDDADGVLAEAVARVTLDVATRREQIIATYEPSGDARKVAHYVTKLVRTAMGERESMHAVVGGPAPSTLRNWRRAKVTDGTEGLVARRDAAKMRQAHHDPDGVWKPLGTVAGDLARRFRIGPRTVQSIFHREVVEGRMHASKRGSAWALDRDARQALGVAVQRWLRSRGG